MTTSTKEKRIPTACPLDCPDSCSLQITTESGRVTAVEAGPGNPLTSGFICSKVRRYPEHLYHTTRVMHPLRRTGPKGENSFEQISWEQALEIITDRMTEVRRDFGGEAILPLCYGGSNGLLTQDTTDMRLFRRLGASNLLRTVCAAPSTAAAVGLTGGMTGVALTDYEHAKLIVLWGVNPSVSSIHLVPIIRRAQQAGTKLVVIDPRATPLAKKADLHLAPKPGTDVVLALAIANSLLANGHHDQHFLDEHCTGVSEFRQRAAKWSIDEAANITGLAAHEITAFVELYRVSNPAVIRCGWGVERNRHGGSAVASILALPAIAGKFKVLGGGYTMSNSGAWRGDARLSEAILEDPPPTRDINMNQIGAALTASAEKVQLLFVYNCNPLVTLPRQDLVRQGLEREDLFTVVFDPIQTETAHYADIVLPGTTFLEHEDLAKGYGALIIHRTKPAIEPLGESRSNHWVFGELLQRTGLHRTGEPLTGAELRNHVLSEDSVSTILRGDPLTPAGGASPIQFVDTLPTTSDKKFHLVPESLDSASPKGLYSFTAGTANDDFPLALLSPATNKTTNSTMGQLGKRDLVLQLSPEDAAQRGLGQDQKVIVRAFNQFGEVICPLSINPDLRSGIAVLPKGVWLKSSMNGTTSNVLVPDTLSDLGGGACFNDARIQVERVDRSSYAQLIP